MRRSPSFRRTPDWRSWPWTCWACHIERRRALCAFARRRSRRACSVLVSRSRGECPPRDQRRESLHQPKPARRLVRAGWRAASGPARGADRRDTKGRNGWWRRLLELGTKMSGRRPQTEPELVELLRSIDVPAPEELHRRIDTLVAERAPRRRRRVFRGRLLSPSWRLGGATATLAALAVALVLGLAGGGSSSLDVRAASALTLLPATIAAPAESARERAHLAVAVDGIAFPYWDRRFGWHSVGARRDLIDGRTVRTVFYADGHGQRIGYAIVAGIPAPRMSGVVVRRGGTPYRLITEHGVQVVTWLRDGRLCIVAGRGVNSATLLRLASWEDRGAVA